MKRFAIALVIVALSIPAFAGELKGVSMADRITVDGKPLVLNGMGLRTKMSFKVYVAGLYLEAASKDAGSILASDQIRRVEMVMTRDLEKGRIIEAVETGFEKNNKAKLPSLKARLDQFNAGLTDLKEGDSADSPPSSASRNEWLRTTSRRASDPRPICFPRLPKLWGSRPINFSASNRFRPARNRRTFACFGSSSRSRSFPRGHARSPRTY